MLFEVCAHPPPLVVGEGVAVLLKEGVDAGNAPVPTVLKVFQGQTSTSSHVTGVSDKSLVQLGVISKQHKRVTSRLHKICFLGKEWMHLTHNHI